MPGVWIHELTIADEPETWAELGFAVDGDVCRVGSVPIRLAGRDAGRGIVGWTLGGIASEQLDVDRAHDAATALLGSNAYEEAFEQGGGVSADVLVKGRG